MAVFLYIAFYDVDFLKVLEISSQANLFWVIVFILLNFLGHAVRAYRWKFILSSVKPNTKYKNLFNSLLIGYGVNCVTPKLGEVARAIFLARWEGLSRSSMFGTVILERVIDVFFLIISVLIGIYLSTENIQKEFPWLMNAVYFSGLAIILMILLVALALYFKNAFLTIIEKTLGKFSATLSNNLIYIFKMLIEGLLSLKGWKNQLITFVLSSFIIVIYAITSYVGMFMLGMNKIQNINFLMGWVVMSISALGVIIPTPGSTGSYHTLAKSSLVFIYGFDETISAAYAFLTHIISYFFMIASAVIIYLLFGRNINKVRNDVNIQTKEKL
ncbi:MAG: flippase-like domain-containing protein [Ignavibacterium sp.]|nr:flippase-like domain-containing protein [Ignavibacterium sp.]